MGLTPFLRRVYVEKSMRFDSSRNRNQNLETAPSPYVRQRLEWKIHHPSLQELIAFSSLRERERKRERQKFLAVYEPSSATVRQKSLAIISFGYFAAFCEIICNLLQLTKKTFHCNITTKLSYIFFYTLEEIIVDIEYYSS